MGPETRYALSGDVHIAYQVIGEGPFDLVFVPGYVTHMELQWRLPSFGDFLTDLGSFCRLIRFDKRGTGMSDPVSGAPDLETRMDDVRAVMDAAESHRAAFYGLSEGAAMSILFAATYPERTGALVVRSCSPRTLWAPDFPWGRRESAYQREVDQALRVYAPRAEAREAVRALGMQGEDEVEAFIDFIRYGASPGMLAALYRMNREIDIRDVLPTVRVPTLVLHGSEDTIVPVEAAEYTARRLPSARFVELPGVGHLALRAGGTLLQTEMQRFLTDIWQTGGWDEVEPDRMLATVLFTDIVESTIKAIELGDRRWREVLERHNAMVRRELLRYRGREVDTTGDGFLATFDGPARAIRCACAIVDRRPRSRPLDTRRAPHRRVRGGRRKSCGHRSSYRRPCGRAGSSRRSARVQHREGPSRRLRHRFHRAWSPRPQRDPGRVAVVRGRSLDVGARRTLTLL